jgi:electron transfer flavoprotein alpha/beta subunit
MRIVVCVKQVYDPKTVKISRSREELDLRDAVKIFNPPDKYALEAALRSRLPSADQKPRMWRTRRSPSAQTRQFW